MDTNIIVTIGIPFYNSQNFLGLAVKSVLEQSYTNFELILLDDGSTDNSLKIAKSFNDNRVKVISDGINKGLIYRLNQLINISQGKYFVRMDSDDIMFPYRIEKQVKLIETYPNLDLVYTDAISINNSNAILGYRQSKQIYKRKGVLKGQTPIHPSVCAKLSFYKENKYDEKYAQMEDFELWYRTIENHNYFHLNEPCIFYREESTSISQKHKRMIKAKINFASNYNFNHLEATKIVLKTRIKWYIYSILERFNLQNILLSKRYKVMSAEEIKYYDEILSNILKK